MEDLLLETAHTYHGFLLEKTEQLEDICSAGYLFRHTQSGARLLYLKNNDKNKVFSVAFKTPPENSCGTPHILEHSVLCGSQKYTAKDPFNELAKGSLNTFLNAMTYADKTMYPVASCNEKDFHNLMDVYLDAVFFPKIYEKKEIFQQEGWRYVLKDADAPLEITGVVYNEMKGALSDPESLLNNAICRSIFGDTTYGFESCADPSDIPKLTYEDFLNFHRKNYHPSNSYLYLYGDMDLQECLKHIGSYLSRFQCSENLPVITETDCVQKGKILRETYPVPEDGESGGCYLTCNYKAGHCTDSEHAMAMQILSYILLETNSSPLKNALLEKEICEETDGWFDSSCYEMVFSVIAKNAAPQKLPLFLRTIEETLLSLAEKGIPSALLESALRKFEFLLLEEDFGSTPKGLIYFTRIMKSWLHGESPFANLRLNEILESIKKKSKNGYFETLIRTVFLENREQTVIQFEPEKGKGRKEAETLQAHLAQKKAAMSTEEIERILEENRNLELFQTQEDSAEVLAQIPQLELSEIDTEPVLTEYRRETLAGKFPLLFVPLESRRIVYWKLHFDTSAVPQELLPYTGLLTEILGKLDTENYSFQNLPTAINECFGDFTAFNEILNKNAAEYRSFVTVRGKLLREDMPRALALAEEILLHTDFEKLENLKKVVKSAKIRQENYILNNSHLVGIFCCGSHIFEGLEMEEQVSGINFYRFLCQVDEALEKEPPVVTDALRKTADLLFRKNNLEISLGCEENDFGEIKEKLHEFTERFPQKDAEPTLYRFTAKPAKNAYTCAGGVAYNCLAFDMKKYGLSYHGSYQVLRTIVNLEYLWNSVRVQGGAYGCGCQFQRSGLCYFYSYRDPNLLNTYEIYRHLWQEISKFHASDREMAKYILGTISRLDQPKINTEKFNAAINRYYKGISDEELKQERLEVLHTSASIIQDCAALLQMAEPLENVCTIGNEQLIKKNAGMFTEVKPLI